MFLPCTINKIKDDNKLIDIQFINVAYRPEPPKEATGGPNGVLKIQKEVIGDRYRGFYQRYIFEPPKLTLPNEYSDFFKKYKIGTMTKKLIEAEYYFQYILYNELPIKKYVSLNKKYIFICHDIGSAVGAYRLGFSYILIYHQQGAFIHERTSFGENLSVIEKTIMNKYEEIAFKNAEKVYFPSIGAKESFLNTTVINNKDIINFSDEPLYNTVNDFKIDAKSADKFFIDNGYSDILDCNKRLNYLIFISIGDYTQNKGIDRCPHILNLIANKTNKKILWIVIGSKHKSGIYEQLLKEYKNDKYNFNAIFIPVRLEHSLAMGILEKSDYLLMLQRFSIFDFSTLEAMKLNKNLILSNCGGNLEFNKEDNVIIINPDNIEEKDIIKIIQKRQFNNNLIFNKYFSKQIFLSRYQKIYDYFINNYIKDINKNISNDDLQNDLELDGMIRNKEIIIIGPGFSASQFNINKYKDHVLIALNSALKLNIPFNIHFMQDQPNPVSLYDIYLKRNVKRVYGKINRPITENLSIDFNMLDSKKINYTKYNLSNTIFDPRYEKFDFNCKQHVVFDMYGILFSAIQIIGACKPKSIKFIGIDFSEQNVNGANPNKYNNSVYGSFEICCKNLCYSKIEISIIATTSQEILNIVNKYSTKKSYNLIENYTNKKNIQQKKNNINNTKEKNKIFNNSLYRKTRKLFLHPIKFFKDIK